MLITCAVATDMAQCGGRMVALDAITAAGLVLRVAWLPSARCYRASATRSPESASCPTAPQSYQALQFARETARGDTATVAVERLYAALVTAGVVPYDEDAVDRETVRQAAPRLVAGPGTDAPRWNDVSDQWVDDDERN